MPPSKVRPQCKAIRQKVCKSCEHVFRAKRQQKSIRLLIIIGACAIYTECHTRTYGISCLRYICTKRRGFCTLVLFFFHIETVCDITLLILLLESTTAQNIKLGIQKYSQTLFINPRRACAEGLLYLSCLCVCVSVCYHSSANIARFYAQRKVRRGLS